MAGPSVYLFWDNSNIYIPAQNVAAKREGIHAPKAVRIQFDNLRQLAVAGRTLGAAVCVGSIPPDMKELWDRLRKTGVKVELFERGGESGQEQGVDQCLQVHILRAGLDNPDPQIAVLLTGDGKGYLDGVGYHADIERLQKRGWGVEVLSWDVACNARLRQWATNNGVYVPLESFYDSVTFLEGSRKVKPLNLTHRKKATVT